MSLIWVRVYEYNLVDVLSIAVKEVLPITRSPFGEMGLGTDGAPPARRAVPVTGLLSCHQRLSVSSLAPPLSFGPSPSLVLISEPPPYRPPFLQESELYATAGRRASGRVSAVVVAHIAAAATAGLFPGYRLEPIKPLCFALPESGACALFSFCGRHVSLRRRRSGFSTPARAAIIAPSQMNTVARLQGPRWGFEMPPRPRRCPSKGFVSRVLFTHSYGCGYRGAALVMQVAGCRTAALSLFGSRSADWCLILRTQQRVEGGN